MKIIYCVRNTVLIFICFICFGCAAWTKVGGEFSNDAMMYKADLPWGWMKFRGKDLLITKNGRLLESIEIKRLKIDKKLDHTKKKFTKGMLPNEIAEVYIDNMIANPIYQNFELIENVPSELSGQDAFKLGYSFRNEDGLKYKSITFGFLYDVWVYLLDYTSTNDHYFDKSVNEFDAVVKSFQFIPMTK